MFLLFGRLRHIFRIAVPASPSSKPLDALAVNVINNGNRLAYDTTSAIAAHNGRSTVVKDGSAILDHSNVLGSTLSNSTAYRSTLHQCNVKNSIICCNARLYRVNISNSRICGGSFENCETRNSSLVRCTGEPGAFLFGGRYGIDEVVKKGHWMAERDGGRETETIKVVEEHFERHDVQGQTRT